MKYCKDCDNNVPFDNFHKNASAKGGLAAYCKPCMNARRRTCYRKRGNGNAEGNRRRAAEYAKRNNDFIDRVRSRASCVDCGNSDPRVLDFDHVKGKKTFSIAASNRVGASIERIKKEMRKCQIRCSNCHRIRHYDLR